MGYILRTSASVNISNKYCHSNFATGKVSHNYALFCSHVSLPVPFHSTLSHHTPASSSFFTVSRLQCPPTAAAATFHFQSLSTHPSLITHQPLTRLSLLLPLTSLSTAYRLPLPSLSFLLFSVSTTGSIYPLPPLIHLSPFSPPTLLIFHTLASHPPLTSLSPASPSFFTGFDLLGPFTPLTTPLTRLSPASHLPHTTL